MKYLILSKFGDGLSLSIQLGSEGNEVKAYVTGDDKTETDRRAKQIGQGWVDRVYGLKEGLAWNPDVVICDRNNVEDLANISRARGFPTFGCSPLHIKLEKDRAFALTLAQQHGLDVPAWHKFKTPDEAIAFLTKQDNKWVMKFGEGSDVPTRIVESSKDGIAFLKRIAPKDDMIIEEYVNGVSELNVEAWFSNGRIVPGSINYGMEQKRFLAGDLGINTGCESNYSWYPTELGEFDTVFTPELLSWLKQQRYSGPLDIASILTHDGNYSFVEFTPRLGYAAVYCLLPLLRSDLGELLYNVSRGFSSYVDTITDYSFGLTLSMAPYPYDIVKQLIPGEEVIVPEEAIFWPMDLTKLNGVWQTTGSYNLLGYLTATHPQAQEAATLTMSYAGRVVATNLQYRIDAGSQINIAKDTAVIHHPQHRSHPHLPNQPDTSYGPYPAIQHPMFPAS